MFPILEENQLNVICRIARHTSRFEEITNFYTQILGLEVLGEFKDHAGYKGIFLGLTDADWHLEFTSDGSEPQHDPDKDDLLVFYPQSGSEYTNILQRFNDAGIARVAAKNPYWNDNGVLFEDPDGFGIVISHLKCK